jgi:hypothetical protein
VRGEVTHNAVVWRRERLATPPHAKRAGVCTHAVRALCDTQTQDTLYAREMGHLVRDASFVSALGDAMCAALIDVTP